LSRVRNESSLVEDERGGDSNDSDSVVDAKEDGGEAAEEGDVGKEALLCNIEGQLLVIVSNFISMLRRLLFLLTSELSTLAEITGRKAFALALSLKPGMLSGSRPHKDSFVSTLRE
jgi:hypothetical protein